MLARMCPVESSTWPGDWTYAIGRAVRAARMRRGLSAQALSQRTAELGFEIPRNAIANLEHRRKSTIGVHEISVLARALNLSPLELVIPAAALDRVEVAPGRFAEIWDEVVTWVRPWMMGEIAGLTDLQPEALQPLEARLVLYQIEHLYEARQATLDKNVAVYADLQTSPEGADAAERELHEARLRLAARDVRDDRESLAELASRAASIARRLAELQEEVESDVVAKHADVADDGVGDGQHPET